MHQTPTTKIFALTMLIDGNLISGCVSFSPAPEPAIMTELARFEAERILAQLVTEDIATGHIPDGV